MPQYLRGGRRLGTLQFGRVNCIRQELLHAGEAIRSSITGRILPAPLRETISTPINVSVATFFTPLRWLWDDVETLVRDGNDATGGSLTVNTRRSSHDDCLGAGSGDVIKPVWDVFYKNYLRIYNEHYKWPADADVTHFGSGVAELLVGRKYGLFGCNLPAMWTRILEDEIVESDYTFVTGQSSSREKIDLRALDYLKSKLKTETDKMYFSQDRYDENLKTIWQGARGNAEVDKVPVRLDLESSFIGGEDIYATSSEGLGERAGLLDFRLDHRLPYRFVAPEHGLISYMLLIRVEPTLEKQVNPFSSGDNKTWVDYLAHPGQIAESGPVKVHRGELDGNASDDMILGVMPRGWQWRDMWSQIDNDIDKRNSFLTQENVTDVASAHYHADMNDAFTSKSLGNAIMDLRIAIQSDSLVPEPFASLYAGT